MRAAENVKRIVDSSGIQWWGDTLSVTVSLGQAVVQQGDSTESILQRAERALESDASREPAQGKGSNLKGLGTSASETIMFAIIAIAVVFGSIVAGYLMSHGNLMRLIQP